MSGSFSNESQAYDQLRSWYLARLRRSALSDSARNSLTPSTLIKRDRAALEQLIASSAEIQPAPRGEKSSPFQNIGKFAREHIVVCFVVILVVVSFVSCAVLLVNYSVDGVTLPLNIVIVAVFIPAFVGAIISLIAFYRQWAESTARVRHEQSIADYALDAFWSFDKDLNFIATSPATSRLWGHDNKYLVGKPLKVLLKDESSQVERRFESIKMLHQPQNIDCRILRSDGSLADIEIEAEYSETESGYFCVVVDVTERKNVERYKQQVMQMLSHDLKSPLTALQFSLALIAKGKYGDLSQEGLKMAQLGEKNTERLIALVDQLLDLQKIDANRLELKLTDVSVEEIVAEATDTIEQFAAEKNMSIVAGDFGDFIVNVDSARLVQVLVNFLSNAVKYSPAGTAINITARPAGGGRMVELRVSDAGPGISPENSEKVFDQFYRVPGHGHDVGGTGLGLSICRAIIQAHGGEIGVTSTSGEGSTFWCRVPVKA